MDCPDSDTDRYFRGNWRRTGAASLELAAALVVWMAANYVLASHRPAGSVPDSVRRIWWPGIASLEFPAANGRTLGADDAGGAREISPRYERALQRPWRDQSKQGDGLTWLACTNTWDRGYTMHEDVSTFRLYLMRLLYLLNFVGLGLSVWPAILKHQGLGDPLQAVAVCFWAALSALMGLGLRYPLKMLPLSLLQILYKAIWLTAVALPLRSAGQSSNLTKPFVIGVILDLIVIPWPYVLANYVKKRGERWR